MIRGKIDIASLNIRLTIVIIEFKIPIFWLFLDFLSQFSQNLELLDESTLSSTLKSPAAKSRRPVLSAVIT